MKLVFAPRSKQLFDKLDFATDIMVEGYYYFMCCF